MNRKAVFATPQNPDDHIWRYMDFTKFASMLENGGLYFSRSDKLGDPFEGFYPKGTELAREGSRERAAEVFGQLAEGYLKGIDRKRVEISRKYVMVSCWHMNQYESPAMWKMYAKSNEAVAIRSTYSALRRCLDLSVDIGVINYVDDMEFVSEYSGLPEEM